MDVQKNSHAKGHPILEAAQAICESSSMIGISHQRLEELAGEILRSNNAAGANDSNHWLATAPQWIKQFLAGISFEERLLLLTIFHCAGFCYWGEPSWQISDHGKKYNGSMAWLICLSKEKRLLSPAFLAELSHDDWQIITCGESGVPMPLSQQRIELLGKLGEDLQNKRYSPLTICTAGGAALSMAFLIGKTFPGFDDFSKYKNFTLPFLKRAQLLVADYHYLCGTDQDSTIKISAIEELTAFADYKIPQFLRHKNILVYAPHLSELVDTQKEICAGSAEEIEIRSATIVAIQSLKQILQALDLSLDARELDNRLWLAAQSGKDKMRPYHRCRTIFY